MQLNPDAFAALLDNFAEPFVYRKAYACPCINPNSGSPAANCEHCAAKGWLWTEPEPAEAAVCSSSVQLEWAKMGNWESGDMVVSIPYTSSLYRIAQFDRLTPLANTDQRSLALVRGAPKERLHGTVSGVLRVFWFDDAGSVVEGLLPNVAPNGTLSWPDGGAPPVGKSYSITYGRYSDYYCFGPFSNDRHKHGGLLLPRKMVMRRFDLLGRTPSPKTV